MDESNENERIQPNRNLEDNQSRMSVNIIVVILLFECIGFYSFQYNVDDTLKSKTGFNWNSNHSLTISQIFYGKSSKRIFD